jgi:NAD(P)-dependent dehydrogenase (short-subunit alcohol dehydrogenase family)
MAATKRILVIGATGVIGKYILDQLLLAKDNAGFENIAILTSKGTVDNKADEISKLKSKRVEVIVGDVTKEEDVKNAYDGQQHKPERR